MYLYVFISSWQEEKRFEDPIEHLLQSFFEQLYGFF